jgi:chromosomal replication initiator protein
VLTSELTDTWERISQGLRQALPEAAYEIWLEPLRPVAHVGQTLTVEAPQEVGAWVRQRFGPVLNRVAREVLGPDALVDVVAIHDSATQPAGSVGRQATPATTDTRGVVVADDRELNPKFTFEQFVIGDANRLAHAAALAVAELPGQAYNPLFIYGPPGVGKTHLLHSIGNYIRAYGGGMTVRCATAEHFTNEFVAALQSKRIDAFKGRYRRNDVLLIDDVQFLQDKTHTEEEFFHTFNALHETGGQLVLTCDRLPRDMDALEERLRERFEAGLLADIQPPDLATRVGVLRKRASFDGIDLRDDEVLEIIAHRVSTNIRALEGALIRVVAFSSLTGRPITAALAEEVLAGLYPGGGRERPVSVERIQELVCSEFRISREELLSTSRAAKLTWPRHLAMSLAREHTDETLPAIGAKFGGRHHTTVMHAIRHTAERMAADPDAYRIVRALTERLLGGEADRDS